MRFRGFAVAALMLAAISAIAACGGGGGGGGNGAINPPPPVASPSPSPSVSPMGSPFVCPSGGCTSFALAGTSTQRTTRTFPTPTPPVQVINSTVGQSINVIPSAGPFHGQIATDYKTAETDTAPLQIITTNTDNYILFPASTGNIVNIGYHSTDSNSVVMDVQYLAGNGIIGQIPLGAGWVNNASSIISESDPDGTTIAQTINPDGSYSLTKTEVAGTTTATLNSDGSGTAIVPVLFFGSGTTGSKITVPVQSKGTINYTISAVGALPPTPAPIVIPVPAWYSSSPKLAGDKSTNLGVQAIPAGCVAPAFGSSGVDLRQQETQLDTIFGLLDNETTDTWVTGVGPVCQRISDTLDIFYDFTGQSGFAALGNVPIQTDVFTELIGVRAAARSSSKAHTLTANEARASLAPQLVLAQARLERWRFAVLKGQLTHLHEYLQRRNHL